MISMLAVASLAAAICQTNPIEKAFSPEKLKELPHLYRQNATLMKCEKTARERVVVSSPIRKENLCFFSELDLELHTELMAVASISEDNNCPAISFVKHSYPGSDWVFRLGDIFPQDALQIKTIVSRYGIALLDKESEDRKGEIPNIYYGTNAFTAFSVATEDMELCRDRKSPIKKMSYVACSRANVYNDTIWGWHMFFAKQLDGVYIFVASSRIVY